MAFEAYNRFRSKGEFIDLHLKAEGQVFDVHCMVVCAASEYFEKLAMHDRNESDISSAIVELHDVPARELGCLLDFLYTGVLSIDTSICISAYKLADYLMMHDAVVAVRYWLLNKLADPLALTNSLLRSCLELASKFDDETLKSACLNVIQYFPLQFFEVLPYYEESDVMNFIEKAKFVFHENNNFYMGSSYVSHCRRILDCNFPHTSREKEAIDRIFKQIGEQTSAFSAYCCPADCRSSWHQVVDHPLESNFADLQLHSHAEFPPTHWTIANMMFYHIDSWRDNSNIICGVDLTYRNLWTGETKVYHYSDPAFVGEARTVSVLLEPGETIRTLHIQADFWVENMQFITSKGRCLMPFGRISGTDCVKWGPEHQHYFSSDSSHTLSNDLACLHGFSYSIDFVSGSVAWAHIKPVFSVVSEQLVKECPFIDWTKVSYHI